VGNLQGVKIKAHLLIAKGKHAFHPRDQGLCQAIKGSEAIHCCELPMKYLFNLISI
jgi:hypothetical protein